MQTRSSLSSLQSTAHLAALGAILADQADGFQYLGSGPLATGPNVLACCLPCSWVVQSNACCPFQVAMPIGSVPSGDCSQTERLVYWLSCLSAKLPAPQVNLLPLHVTQCSLVLAGCMHQPPGSGWQQEVSSGVVPFSCHPCQSQWDCHCQFRELCWLIWLLAYPPDCSSFLLSFPMWLNLPLM